MTNKLTILWPWGHGSAVSVFHNGKGWVGYIAETVAGVSSVVFSHTPFLLTTYILSQFPHGRRMADGGWRMAPYENDITEAEYIATRKNGSLVLLGPNIPRSSVTSDMNFMTVCHQRWKEGRVLVLSNIFKILGASAICKAVGFGVLAPLGFSWKKEDRSFEFLPGQGPFYTRRRNQKLAKILSEALYGKVVVPNYLALHRCISRTERHLSSERISHLVAAGRMIASLSATVSCLI